MDSTMSRRLTGNNKRRELLLLTAVLLTTVLLLFCLMVAAMQITSGVRGYTSGESMWSKAQKDATFYITEYADTGDEEDWDEYRKYIAVPLADRRGRLALEDASLDSETQYRIAYNGFLEGGNDPKDIPMMIFLFRWFAWEPHFAKAIDIWRRADAYILATRYAAEAVRTEHLGNTPNPRRLSELKQIIHDHDYELRPLEDEFSRVLGEAAHWVQNALLLTMLFASIILLVIGVWLNRRITAERFAAEAHLRATFEQAAVGMAHLSLDGHWLEVNDRLCRMLGFSAARLTDMRVLDVVHPDDVAAYQQHIKSMQDNHADTLNFEKRLVCADQEIIWTNVNTRLLRDIRGNPLYFFSVIEDVTESRHLSERLSHQASHDALTDLINRYEFERRLRQAMRRAEVEGVTNALFFLDLDEFKIVNDTCGHVAGDEMLKQISSLIRSCIRNNDTLARLGGDEFALLLEACPAESARKLAEKIREAIREFRFHWEGQVFNLGVSIGVVPFDAEQQDIDGLMSAVDTACYAAKEAGRNRVHMAEPGDPEVGRHLIAMQWQQRLRDALDNERFFLAWQPMLKLGDPASVERQFEVLLRMRDETGQVIPPGEFLPAAERFGIIREMDRWVLETTLNWLTAMPDRLDSIDHVSVNVSGVTMNDEGFTEDVIRLLDKHAIPAGKLCLEITETAVITNIAAAQAMMETLNERGCRFALDDFGRGVSSFAYLNSLPVDCVKIDGAFVRDMDTNPVHAAMVRSINDIAHAMGKQTVAEFVETSTVCDMLAELGVDFAQGYGIGRPAPLGERN